MVEPDGLFEGYFCPALSAAYFEQHEISIVHVKGSGPKKKVDEWFVNPFGHTLLWLGGGIGFVHSCEPGQHKARYIPSEEWERYCKKMGKPPRPEQVIQVGKLITDMGKVRESVNDKLLNGWNWVPWCNCSAMVDAVLRDGGVPEDYLSNSSMPSSSVSSNKSKANLTTIRYNNFPGGTP
jgi:hypothetical protein